MIRCSAGATRLLLIPALFVWMIFSVPAVAQVPANVPDATKIAADPSGSRAQLQAFIDNAVKGLTTGTSEERRRARLSIEAGVVSPGPNGTNLATKPYTDLYCQLLATSLVSATTHPDVAVRMNAAIAVANVVEAARNTYLANLVKAFINDKSDVVVLWGIKAAKWLIPIQLALANPDLSILNAITPAVKAHSNGIIGGAIATEAYDAMTLGLLSNRKVSTTPAMFKLTAPQVLALLDTRLQLYRLGVPPAPRAESLASGFLTHTNVWSQLTPEQRVGVIQSLCDLLALATQQAAAPTVDKGDFADLAVLIAQVGGAVTIKLGEPAELKPLSQLQPNGAAIQTALAPLLKTVRANEAFKAIKDPPTVQGNKPAPAAATAPTTLPGVSAPNTIIKSSTPPAAPPAPAPKAPAEPKAATPPGNTRTPPPPRTTNATPPPPPASATPPGYGAAPKR